jgi:hypothetical protein
MAPIANDRRSPENCRKGGTGVEETLFVTVKVGFKERVAEDSCVGFLFQRYSQAASA